MNREDEERRRYKGVYNRFMMQPAKISTSAFVRLYILYLLSNGNEMYGLEMIEKMEEDFARVSRWKPSPSVVYPILKRMSNQGYITFIKEDPDTNSRKYYRMTTPGFTFWKREKDKFYNIFKEAINMLQLVMDEIYKDKK